MDFSTLINSILTVFVSRRRITWLTTMQLKIKDQTSGRGPRWGRKQPKLHFGWEQLHVGLNAAFKVLSPLSIAAWFVRQGEDNAIGPGFSPPDSLVSVIHILAMLEEFSNHFTDSVCC